MFEELVKEITKELEAKESRGRSRSGDAQNNFEYAVCYILVELWKASLSYPQRECTINLRNGYYSELPRYRDDNLTYRQIKAAFDGMINCRMIEITTAGYFSRERGEGGLTKFISTDKLLEKFGVEEGELKKTIVEISKLNPKPGSSYAGNNKIAEQIVPDFSMKIIDGELDLTLNSRNAPELHVSREYNNMLKGYQESREKSKSQKDAVMFIKQKLDAAKWFIDAIKQRQQTLLVTMNAIMHYQYEYFLTGDERKLKPMILKDIADQINMDISTVSRVANSKYVNTPYGTKLIKEFFSESMKNDQGEDISTKEIKNILQTVIAEENKKRPLTDEKLTEILKEKGYPIARRTIAKYREQLDLPVARLRKQI
mgnify:CR=1 FL=1